ncbi:hypothetical protein BKA62DRAFT_708898 [Auriculariales sp. MPI-PUGE-AT-0066]|nr:hypothetical protein BKA62DRAFT_708898 [Auriculariales sp. MPI-PUGE-AT-0066]
MSAAPAHESSVQKLVRPVEPTVLAGQDFFELRPTDLFLTFRVETAIVVPGALNMTRVRDAVACALSLYPLYAGRLARRGEQWLVHLNNAGVYVDFVESDADKAVPIDAIVQHPFALANLIDHCFWDDGREDQPLLRITVTEFTRTGEWSFATSSPHLVGDGYIVYTFLRTVSQMYQGLEPLELVEYLRPPLSALSLDAPPVDMDTPWLDVFYPYGTLQPHQHPVNGTPTERIDFRMTAEQIIQLKAGVILSGSDTLREQLAKISAQDALAATLAAAMTESAPDAPPIRTVTTHINFRGAVGVPLTSACNALVQAVAHTPSESPSDVAPFALAIRKSLLDIRNPANLPAIISKTGARFVEAARTKHYTDFSSAPGALNINSTRPFAWTSAHFGYPGRARFFHTCSDAPRYVKIFTPNPTRTVDAAGQESWKDWKGGAEVTFFIEPRYRGAFIDSFSAKARELGVEGDIEFFQQ